MKTHINGNTIEQIMTNAVILTQAQYDALPLEQKNHGTYIISDSSEPSISATNVAYSTGVSVKDKLDSKINPPDLSNITRESLTSDTAMEVTSTGKWYCVTAENQSTGSCFAYILDSSNTNYLSAGQSPDGQWKRVTTSWLYFPVGAKFYVRAIFTYKGQLCSAPSL